MTTIFKTANIKTRLQDITAEECKKLCKESGFIYKEGLENRVFLHVITDGSVDKDGDIVNPKGVNLKVFKSNPTVLWSHDNSRSPVGRSIKVWYDKDDDNIKSLTMIYDSEIDISGESEKVFNFLKYGAINACSIGFIAKEVIRPSSDDERKEIGLGKYGAYIKESELLEYSICNIGSNYNAVLKSLKEEVEDVKQRINSKDLERIISDLIEKHFGIFEQKIGSIIGEKLTTVKEQEPQHGSAITEKDRAEIEDILTILKRGIV